MTPLYAYVTSKPRWSFLAQDVTFGFRSSSTASVASQVLSKTHMLMWDRFVCSHALPVYHGNMLLVERIGRSASKIGTRDSAFSNRIASQMCWTTLLMFNVITIRRRRSSWLNNGGCTWILPLSTNRSTNRTSCASRYSRLPFHVGFIWS